MTREDMYHEALEAFIKTSGGDLEVEAPSPGPEADEEPHAVLADAG